MLWKASIAAALGIGTLFAAGCADTSAARDASTPEYKVVMTSKGPRPAEPTLVPVYPEGAARPYGLTGRDDTLKRTGPVSPPKGTHANQ